jgi:MFS family permease
VEKMLQNNVPWYRQLNGYHWFVLIVCTGGWMFDCFDQQLFNLARKSAVTALLGVEPGNPAIDRNCGFATSVLMIGWATGGIIFGILGDRIGRAKTMIFTILSYSVFSGLSGFAPNLPVFLALRFLAGLGVGGQFALGVTLVSESVPPQTRTNCLGMLQAFSAIGNVGAGIVYLAIIHFELQPPETAWRYVFCVTMLPALVLVALNALYLHEPDAWKNVAADRKISGKKGGMTELLSDPFWRRRAFIGLFLAAAGVLGLWAIGVFSSDLTQTIFRKTLSNPKDVMQWACINLILFNVGAFFGMYAFARVTQYLSRRATFAIFFTIAMIFTAIYFGFMNDRTQLIWMAPLMGFAQLSVFGGYAIYFPELFPTRMRSTGTSFCYNIARFLAAGGPFATGWLSGTFFVNYGEVDRFRYAGVTMCACFLVGLIALIFAPETKDKPLPE